MFSTAAAPRYRCDSVNNALNAIHKGLVYLNSDLMHDGVYSFDLYFKTFQDAQGAAELIHYFGEQYAKALNQENTLYCKVSGKRKSFRFKLSPIGAGDNFVKQLPSMIEALGKSLKKNWEEKKYNTDLKHAAGLAHFVKKKPDAYATYIKEIDSPRLLGLFISLAYKLPYGTVALDYLKEESGYKIYLSGEKTRIEKLIQGLDRVLSLDYKANL